MATRTEGGTGDEILINVTPRETRVAVVENGVLQEILLERVGKRGLVGNIYKGQVCRVLPGMEAAFVDIGLERAAFLHVSDIRPESLPDSPTPASGVATISGTMRCSRQTGMPFASRRIIAWQNRKISANAAAMSQSATLPVHTAASANGKKAMATHASRDIHERCGWRNTE